MNGGLKVDGGTLGGWHERNLLLKRHNVKARPNKPLLLPNAVVFGSGRSAAAFN